MSRLKFVSSSSIDGNLEKEKNLTYPELSWEEFLLTLPNVIDAEWCFTRHLGIESHTILTFSDEVYMTWFVMRWS